KTKDSSVVQLNKKADWVIANIQQTGFYRVAYDDQSNEAITNALKSENNGGIHENNRAQFLDDLLSFADGGRKSYDY
uniref:ERAP1-like C-terminal domain-containing protein n=1 Tax=Megaselia scalaris TaxID=36166 RepID=T1GZU4_MEGSC